ncbi:hypothetical protein RJ639_040206 [Escallonia herrerae]|uniref:Phytocyanin domain-containing protein n=1 Tax=Escallonia herrerae TaxID=1293975 RepID=A0AA89B4F7_9ASTE|nr:hypothetical protein RJ639_040206 [Escallonia herrerae]
MAMAAAFLILLLVVPTVYGAEHVVGGSSGWTQSVNYANWAAGETFTVGDTLLFSYGGSHRVDQVSQDDYNNCATGNALTSYTGGQNTIRLTKTGPMYFLCPSFGHCGGGMKLAVTVVAASGTPSGTPPSTTSPPTGSATPTTTPPSTDTPTTTSPPPPSGVAGSFGNMNHLILGISLVLAPIIALMG